MEEFFKGMLDLSYFFAYTQYMSTYMLSYRYCYVIELRFVFKAMPDSEHLVQRVLAGGTLFFVSNY
jgi:hypothetical protein